MLNTPGRVARRCDGLGSDGSGSLYFADAQGGNGTGGRVQGHFITFSALLAHVSQACNLCMAVSSVSFH